MHAMSAVSRLLRAGGTERAVQIPAGTTVWVPAQEHSGENIGEAPTHALFVELKEPSPAAPPPAGALGPR